MSEQNNLELPETWLSKKTIARHYNVSVRTVERWLYAGCPSRMLGGVRRMRLSEIELWLDQEGNAEGGQRDAA